MKALYRDVLHTVTDETGDGVVLDHVRRVSYNDKRLVIDPTDQQIDAARLARSHSMASMLGRRAARTMLREQGETHHEYSDGEIFAFLDENRGEEAHILWVICALGVEMASHKGFFAHFKEWQDAVVIIRDAALWLYETFNDETVEGKNDWDWYLAVEEKAKLLADRYNV